jgi:hypothetical protein
LTPFPPPLLCMPSFLLRCLPGLIHLLALSCFRAGCGAEAEKGDRRDAAAATSDGRQGGPRCRSGSRTVAMRFLVGLVLRNDSWNRFQTKPFRTLRDLLSHLDSLSSPASPAPLLPSDTDVQNRYRYTSKSLCPGGRRELVSVKWCFQGGKKHHLLFDQVIRGLHQTENG